jgi:uncharacterized protein YjbI with pentapeptide repeats
MILLAASLAALPRQQCRAQIYGNEFEPGLTVTWDFEGEFPIDAAAENLEGSLFGGILFRGADFTRANLRGARFYQIRFRNPGDATSKGASFRGADLRRAVWEDFRHEGLQQCDFTDARIENMSCTGPLRVAPEQFLTEEQIRGTMS